MLTERIYEAIEKGDFFGLVQLDLSKAFDLVNHQLLLEKKKLYRCNDQTLTWFESYLTNRTQKVVMNDVHFEESSIKSGVPHGSFLGPLEFLIHINDLPFCIKHPGKLTLQMMLS